MYPKKFHIPPPSAPGPCLSVSVRVCPCSVRVTQEHNHV